jgi:ribosome-associated protein
MTEFKLEDSEFIELNHLLKVTRLCDSGGMANTVIAEGQVKVDGITELRKRRKIRAGQVVGFKNQEIIVTASVK